MFQDRAERLDGFTNYEGETTMDTIKQWTTDDGLVFRATVEPDLDPDVSWLGSYHETMEGKDPGNSDTVHQVPLLHTRGGIIGTYDRGAWYRPQRGREEDWQADEQRLRDYYGEEWSMVVIRVSAYKAGIELGWATLGSVESDSPEYHLDVVDELAQEAGEEARRTLQKLCGS